MPPLLSSQGVAERLGVSRSHVSRLISTGVLPAKDIAVPGARRPTYRVDPVALDAYLDRSAYQPQGRPPALKRRRRCVDQGCKDFFPRA
ncbi:Helix-turn-helix domain protein [Posidoniimonas corsicana]|uniref:Helix-turn-helix domain protein n=1 Tax=Posidoniimonas corsicana TaxID=1938618 RepID=A0A5C5VCC8_9BACT|nr:helix-turn-helix domain-containing protein [Posidoniimonas corsicana]TWT35627.1 Helix-turn-helix domain protein [Posidoniimonas corsicana]